MEQYLVAFMDMALGVNSYVMVPDRKSLAILLGLMSDERYIIIQITPLVHLMNFEDLLSDLTKNNTPNDLNLGTN
jgi:hypothetical protein